jgi:hypothetical protein
LVKERRNNERWGVKEERRMIRKTMDEDNKQEE